MSELANQIETYKASRARINAAGAKHAAKLAAIQAEVDRLEQIKACERAIAAFPPKPEPPPLPAPLVPIPTADLRLHVLTIQGVVAERFGLTRHDLTGPRRTMNIVRPRQIAMYLAKTMTPRSFPEIGRRFGNRDHTTVLHAANIVRRRMQENPDVAKVVEELRAEILG